MRIALDILGAGAVTPAGLTAAQTCAAVRAAVAGLSLDLMSEPFGAEQLVARIPAHWSLRRSEADWLANMALRAVREALRDAPQARRALFLVPPEAFRAHPGLVEADAARLLARVMAEAGVAFGPESRVLDGGAGAALGALVFAEEVLAQGRADEVVLVGVDSYLNPEDLRRLQSANRLLGPDNAQGLVPGEGAVAVRLGRRGSGGGGGAVTLHGVATTREPDRVDGERWSQGRALLAAFAGAAGEDGSAEPHVDFVISTTNGERYVQWEAVLARTRFFRTRRPHLPVVCPAMSVGDIGAAAAPLMLMLAWDAFVRRHAPGEVAMLEATSEGGLRSAAILRGTRAA